MARKSSRKGKRSPTRRDAKAPPPKGKPAHSAKPSGKAPSRTPKAATSKTTKPKRYFAPKGYEEPKAPPKRENAKRTGRGGPSEADLARGRELRARRDRLDREVVQRPDEKRSDYLKRRSKAKTESPRGAPPPPRGSPYKDNATYQRRRGYFYRDAAGRWRTPDGRVAKGQKKVVVERNDAKGRLVKEERYVLPKASKHNDRNRAKLVREDAYYSLISHGAYVSKSRFNRIVGKEAKDRDTIERKVKAAYERGDLDRKPSRNLIRRDIDDSFSSSRDATVSIEMGDEAREIAREGRDGYVDDQGNHISQEELEDIWEREFYGDFDYDDWFDDFDTDAGDTP